MNCFVCGDLAGKFVDKKSDVAYYQCESCECIFKSPDVHGNFAEQKERYDLHENSDENNGYRAYFQSFIDFIFPLSVQPQNALDFGCGESTLLAKMLEEKGIECDSYDPIYHPATSYNSKKYELITSVEVFEHLHHPKEVFSELIHLLEEGGFLAIRTEFATMNIEKFKQWYYRSDPTHVFFFSERTFEKLCSENFCEIVKCNEKNMILIKKLIQNKD